MAKIYFKILFLGHLIKIAPLDSISSTLNLAVTGKIDYNHLVAVGNIFVSFSPFKFKLSFLTEAIGKVILVKVTLCLIEHEC